MEWTEHDCFPMLKGLENFQRQTEAISRFTVRLAKLTS